MDQLSLDVVVTRGSVVESRHQVHAAVVSAGDALVAGAHDSGLVTYWRSCAKPFQVMPLLDGGGFDQIGWGDDQLALACASHGGEPEHVKIVEGMLSSIGMEEGDLACGPHEPLSQRGLKLLRDAASRPTRLHNNCSGKHAAMLARAFTAALPTFGYERQDHPVQQGCLAEVAKWTGVDATQILQAVDRSTPWRAPTPGLRTRRGAGSDRPHRSSTRCRRDPFSSGAPIGSTARSSKRPTAA
jgi:L-asparaginase II